LELKVSSQPKVSALLRIVAGTCALLWLVGIAVCGIARVCNCAGHGGVCAAHASPVHEHAAVSPHEQGHSPKAEHHHGAEVHQHAAASHHDDGEAPKGHCGKSGCDDERCCSTIQALTATMTPIVIAKPPSQPVLHKFLLCAAREHVFAVPRSGTLRRARPRDWVFTPVVCLGPALRSLAPPAFI
jgi:hypothetical protein